MCVNGFSGTTIFKQDKRKMLLIFISLSFLLLPVSRELE